MDLASLTANNTLTGLPYIDPNYLIPVSGGFENMTDVYVPPDVSTILSLGPKFVPPTSPSFGDFIQQLVQINSAAERKHIDPSTSMGHYLESSYNVPISALTSTSTPLQLKLSHMLKQTMNFLNTHKDPCTVQSDKSKSLALTHQSEHREKMTTWINKCIAKNVYSQVTDMDALKRHRQNWHSQYRQISTSLKDHCSLITSQQKPHPLPSKLQKQLDTSNNVDQNLPCLYGVAKTHKDGKPCRPIVNTRSWYSYGLQKLVCFCLQKVFNDKLCPNNVKDISDAAGEIRTIIPFPGYVFAKLDVVDMYTSMDRNKILNILTLLINDDLYRKEGPIPAAPLLRCLRLCLSDQNFFTYDSKVYQQLRGLPQGACDSGFPATLQLDQFLQRLSDGIFVKNHVIKWWKYIDDVLLYLPMGAVDILCQDIMDKTDPEFTKEYEEPPTELDKSLQPDALAIISFLDPYIIRTSSRVLIRTHKKPMASDRLCHFPSSCPDEWKTGTIEGYVDRCLKRVSNSYLLHDLTSLHKLFISGMYPSTYVDPIVYKMVNLYIERYIQTLNTQPQSHYNFYYNLGDLHMRLEILSQYLKTYIHEWGCPKITPMHISPYSAIGRKIVYHRSIKYVCEEFRVVMKRIYTELGLGVPTHRNGDGLFKKLRMSLIDPDVSLGPPTTLPIMHYIIECGDCPTVFFISTSSPIGPVFTDCLTNPNDSIFVHMRGTGHHINQFQLPRPLNLKIVNDIPIALLVTLMRLMFHYNGYEFKTREDLALLSSYIKSGAEKALRQIPNGVDLIPPNRLWLKRSNS